MALSQYIAGSGIRMVFSETFNEGVIAAKTPKRIGRFPEWGLESKNR